jgi:hypothetical protein
MLLAHCIIFIIVSVISLVLKSQTINCVSVELKPSISEIILVSTIRFDPDGGD